MAESRTLRSLGYRKSFYKVGEVCALTGLEGHVLRYWEEEFAPLSPRKSRGGQRLYRPSDIELLLRIKDLLYEQGFTIAGARRRLQSEANGAGEIGGGDVGDLVAETRREVRAILTMLDANDTL